MSPRFNDYQFARQEILSRPPDDAGRKFLERMESERKQNGRDREEAAQRLQVAAERKYACQAGHVMRADEMDKKRTRIGCCPQCAAIDFCQPLYDDDPALRADPQAEHWEH